MGECRDCKWWDELREADYALCLFLSTREGGEAHHVLTDDADHPAWAIGEGYTPGDLWTTARFGCNQFAPREP